MHLSALIAPGKLICPIPWAELTALLHIRSLRYIVVADGVVYLHSNFRGGLRKMHVF